MLSILKQKLNFIKMNIKEVFILSIIYLCFIVIGTVLFISLFWVDYFHKMDVLFFRSVVLLIIVCCIISFLLITIKKKIRIFKIITYRDILLICTLLFSLNYFLYIMIPFNFSRSNSVLLVSYLYKNKGIPKTEEEITNFIIDKYFYKYKAVSVRLNEQIVSGNIQKIDNGYVLTKRGENIVELFGFITDLYNEKNNFSK